MKNLDKLAVENNLLESQKETLIGLRKELKEVLLKELRSWRQKAKIKWAKEGDAKTRLYHRMVNGHKRKSMNKNWNLIKWEDIEEN